MLPLVHAARAGDSVACIQLIERYTPLIHRLNRHVPYPEREDSYQETICEMISLIHEFNATLGSFGSYLKTKLSWRMMNYRRRMVRQERAVIVDEPVQPGPDGDDITIRNAVSSLPNRQRHVLVRSYWNDLPVGQIAAELGIGERAVRGLRARAEVRVREILTGPESLGEISA